MFLTKIEKIIADKFIKDGYVILKVENLDKLRKLQNFIVKLISKNSKNKISNLDILNSYFKNKKSKDLNQSRLKIYNKINNSVNFREDFYFLAKHGLDAIVGNELVMQNKINLSIQNPNDDSSLLNMHADTWSGDSPYEVVVWLPLVDAYKSKSMYILPAKNLKKFQKIFSKNQSNQRYLYNKLKKYFHWLEIKFGEVLIFNQTLPHGNIVNKINETRWSLNCRFKSIFSPYEDKKLGEFFEPITIKPATKIGLKYKRRGESKFG